VISSHLKNKPLYNRCILYFKITNFFVLEISKISDLPFAFVFRRILCDEFAYVTKYYENPKISDCRFSQTFKMDFWQRL